MQNHPINENVQEIDTAALHAMLQGAATREVPAVDEPISDQETREIPRIPAPEPPAQLTPDDTWNKPREPEPVYAPYSGNLWHRYQQWLTHEGNAMGAAILIGFISVIIILAAFGVAFAAKELPSAPSGSWIATERNGTVDFLVGIPTSDGAFSGEWRSLAPGQAQYTIVTISGYIKRGVVHITMRDGVAVAIVGRIVGNGAGARIVFSFATFRVADWNDYNNALLNRGH